MFPVSFCRLYPHVSCFTFHFLPSFVCFPALSLHTPVFSFPSLCQIVGAGVSVFAPHVPWPRVLFAVLPESLEFHHGLYIIQVLYFSSFFWISPRQCSVLSPALFTAWILIFAKSNYSSHYKGSLVLYLPVIVSALGLAFSSHNTSWPSAVIFVVCSSAGFWPRHKSHKWFGVCLGQNSVSFSSGFLIPTPPEKNIWLSNCSTVFLK